MHVLPPEVWDTFAAFGRDMEKRNAYARALRDAEWTLQSISDAAKLTRERVRQIVSETHTADISNLPIPEPPKHDRKAPREYVEPDPAKLARLLELKPLAQQVRLNSPLYREEAEEYTKLLADVHLNDKVTLYRLAKRLGVTHGALRFRLARYGYKVPKNGESKVYTPIRAENRV